MTTYIFELQTICTQMETIINTGKLEDYSHLYKLALKLEQVNKNIESKQLDDIVNNITNNILNTDFDNLTKYTKKELKDLIDSLYKSVQNFKEYIDDELEEIQNLEALAREENYEVPLEAGEDTINLRVKIMRKAEKEGKVFASFETEKFGSVLAQFSVNEGVLSALVAADSETGLDRLRNEGSIEESFKIAGFEEVTFNYIQTDIINVDYFRQHYDSGESDEVTTKRLYNIAKTFIQTVQKAGN